jgi:hypothetical protein
LLAQREYAVEELADILQLGPSTVSHHLARLAKAGLVSARAESYYNYYRLEKNTLEAIASQLLSEEVFPGIPTPGEAADYDQKTLRHFLRQDGSLKTIPAQRKKLAVILRHIVKIFEPGLEYSEKEVNQMLSRFHNDTASLRRELVGSRLLEREKGLYWRVEEPLTKEQPMEV